MNKKEVEGLFSLLAIYRPGDKRLEDKKLQAAWLLVLEPFPPADVKAAVATYFRTSKHFPDVTDIAILCPPQEVEDAPPDVTDRWPGWEANGYRDADDYRAKMREMAEMGRLIDKGYIGAGVPHPSEARKLGWTAETWIERCKEAGIC